MAYRTDVDGVAAGDKVKIAREAMETRGRLEWKRDANEEKNLREAIRAANASAHVFTHHATEMNTAEAHKAAGDAHRKVAALHREAAARAGQ